MDPFPIVDKRLIRTWLFLSCAAYLFYAAAASAATEELLPEKKGAAHAENTRPDNQTVLHLAWKQLFSGIELGLTELPESADNKNNAVFVVLRINPEHHGFTLGMASERGQAFSLPGWSEQENLRAGINAGMYLPDKITNTGYMRNGTLINNSNMGGRLGAFFVAGNRKSHLDPAGIIEKDCPEWQQRLNDYTVVVQNYRLVSSAGELLWPEGGAMHSIAVVANDSAGRILFILCQEPLSVERFAWYLKAFALNCKTVMYVEGGGQAGLFIRMDANDTVFFHQQHFPGATAQPVPGGMVYVWKGQQSLLKTPGSPEALLPNIIGVTRE